MKSSRAMFEELYDAYADQIYRHCFFRVFSRGRAEELMQQAFLKFWEYSTKGAAIENPKALLYRIADHCIIDHKRRRGEESLDALLEASEIEEPSHEGHKEIERGAMMKEVLQEIAKLPEGEKQIVLMRYVDDLDPKEIAEVLETSANSVSVRLNKIMKKLQGKMDTV